jgi:hypothetical protein
MTLLKQEAMLRTLGERLAAEFPLQDLPFLIKLNLAHLMRAEAEALCANRNGPGDQRHHT